MFIYTIDASVSEQYRIELNEKGREYIMKINNIMLNDKDIKNILMRHKCYKLINERLLIEEERIKEEVFSNIPEEYNESDMEHSQIKLDIAKRMYRNTDNCKLGISTSILFMVLAIIGFCNHANNPNIEFTIMIFIFSLLFMIDNVIMLIKRIKISKNLKKYNYI